MTDHATSSNLLKLNEAVETFRVVSETGQVDHKALNRAKIVRSESFAVLVSIAEEAQELVDAIPVGTYMEGYGRYINGLQQQIAALRSISLKINQGPGSL